ncbi:hypothetical protein [Pedobacter arcticus]|uniref:hypothetical protein n=1 Tax=Pedobacter arcticus TaxID=752140 RepID=UPI0012B57952|nr:hypothetical protein [Pedobacter arcticus]
MGRFVQVRRICKTKNWSDGGACGVASLEYWGLSWWLVWNNGVLEYWKATVQHSTIPKAIYNSKER